MGTEVDWSKAPEWATHAFTTGADWDGDERFVGSIEFADESGDRLDSASLTLSSKAWVLIEARPKHSAGGELGEHYNKHLKLKVNQSDADRGFIEVKLDPYINQMANGVSHPVLAHINKKSQRGKAKGHDLVTVLKEIILAAERGIEIEEMIYAD